MVPRCVNIRYRLFSIVQHSQSVTILNRWAILPGLEQFKAVRPDSDLHVMARVEELAELEEAVMRESSIDSFELLQYSGGGSNGAVFLVRCTEATGNPHWR